MILQISQKPPWNPWRKFGAFQNSVPTAAIEVREVKKTSSRTKPNPCPLLISARSNSIEEIWLKSDKFEIIWPKFDQIPTTHHQIKVALKAHHHPLPTHGINFIKIVAKSNEFKKSISEGLKLNSFKNCYLSLELSSKSDIFFL